MSWTRGGQNLACNPTRYLISQDGCMFVLEIPIVELSDAGLYSMHATSPSGVKVTVTFSLNVNVDAGSEKIDIQKLISSIEVRFWSVQLYQTPN